MPVRVVQLGVGGLGQNWWPAFEATAGVQVVGLVDPSPQALAEAAGRFPVPRDACFADVEAPWDRLPADLVIDSLELADRYARGRRALAAGRHLAVCAPLAASLEQAVQLVNQAEQAGLTVVVAQPLRFHPLALKLHDVVREHHLGPVDEVEVEFRTPPASGGLAARPASPGRPDPLVVEGACHHLDLIRWCLMQDGRRAEAADGNVFTFLMDQGTRVTYRVAIADDRPTGWMGRWRVQGRRATMTLADHRLCVADEDVTPAWDDGRPIGDLGLGRLYQVIFNHLLLYMQNLAEPGISGPNNLNSLAMVSAALQSQAERRPIEIVV